MDENDRGFHEKLLSGWGWLAVDWLSQSSKRVGAMRASSPGVRESVVQLGAEVAGVDVGGHLARVVACLEDTPGELVEAERLRARELDDAVQRRADRDVGQGAATSSAASG